MAATKQIYQLKITLQDIEPPIWRTIQVPSTCTFWDLHSYIQDAFGWTNSHLHQFIYTDDHTDGIVNKPIILGIPFEPEYEDDEIALPGWKHKVKRFIEGKTSKIEYVYDFGDNWQHTIELEHILPAEQGVKYPRCIAGGRNGPPEDCGGTHGYEGLLETLFDPSDPEHEDTVAWVDSMKGCTFCPEEFDSVKVKFMSPKKRYKENFD
jgi:hypothetical protein